MIGVKALKEGWGGKSGKPPGTGTEGAGNRSPERRGPRGELYEYYKRIGMLDVYFALFPGG